MKLRDRIAKAIDETRDQDASIVSDAVLNAFRELKKTDLKTAMQIAEEAELDIVADEFMLMCQAVAIDGLSPPASARARKELRRVIETAAAAGA
jgi:hypothetical protein